MVIVSSNLSISVAASRPISSSNLPKIFVLRDGSGCIQYGGRPKRRPMTLCLRWRHLEGVCQFLCFV